MIKFKTFFWQLWNYLIAGCRPWSMCRPDYKKGRIGSSFDDFLKEQGLLEEVEENVKKRIKEEK